MEDPRHRVGALIVRNNKVLLIYRRKPSGVYYVLPGGGVEAGETPKEALAREMKEEAGIDCQVGELLYHAYEADRNQVVSVYHCFVSSDETPEWQEVEKQQPDDVFRFEWVDMFQLENKVIYPVIMPQLLKTFHS